MEIQRIRALRGPNLWSRHTSIEALVVCTPDELRIGEIDGFEMRLRERFPEIGAMRPIGFEGDISMAHVLTFAALGLQAQAGCPVTFCHTAVTVEAGTYQVVFEYTEEAVGRLALELAETLCRAARHNEACVNWTRTSASVLPPAPSSRPLWRVASLIAA